MPEGGTLAVGSVVAAPGIFALVADGEGPLAREAAGEGGEVGQGAVGEEADHGGGEGFVFGRGEGDGAFGWALRVERSVSECVNGLGVGKGAYAGGDIEAAVGFEVVQPKRHTLTGVRQHGLIRCTTLHVRWLP